MYFSEDFYPTEIADTLDIDINELGIYIFGPSKDGKDKDCWYRRKIENNPSRHIATYVSVKPNLIKKTEAKILDRISKALEDIEGQENPLSVKDLKDLTDSMEKIDKIGRLEDGKATSHVVNEKATFSLRDIVAKKIENIKDAEFKEIEEDDKDS